MPTLNGKQLAICIPTYKRPHLLTLLIRDLINQTIQPHVLVVIDGDPGSGAVMQTLSALSITELTKIIYVPSNHGNLAYQRYLAWRAAQGVDYVLFLDDDLRVDQPDAIEKLIAPFNQSDRNTVGITCRIRYPNTLDSNPEQRLLTGLRNPRIPFARWLGSSKSTPPGDISPLGLRSFPLDTGEAYIPILWLSGGVMAYKMDALTEDCFSEDMFALDSIRCGLGEDTFLSRRVSLNGDLLLATCVTISHPNADTPKSYPYQVKHFAYATAYSRRFQNDHFRLITPPRMADRLVLLKSYIGITIFSWLRALSSFQQYYYAYAWGYTIGAIRGLIQKPTARNLTPKINWWQDAESALSRIQKI